MSKTKLYLELTKYAKKRELETGGRVEPVILAGILRDALIGKINIYEAKRIIGNRLLEIKEEG